MASAIPVVSGHCRVWLCADNGITQSQGNGTHLAAQIRLCPHAACACGMGTASVTARGDYHTSAACWCHADNDRRLAKAANDGMLRKLRKEAQKESKAAKKKLQRQLDQDSRGTKQKPVLEARSWASDEEEFREVLPRTDSGQGGRRLLI